MKKILLAGLIVSGSLFAQTRSLEWGQVENQWSPQFEQQYSQFIATLGKARARGFCTTTHNCLINPKANPRFYRMNPRSLQIKSDCADLPFVLRSYFAWMNHLPFSFPSWPVKVLTPELEKLALRIEGYDQKVSNARKVLSNHKKDQSKIEREIAQRKDQLRSDREHRSEIKSLIKELKAKRKELKKVVKDDAKAIKNLQSEKSSLKKDLARRSKKYSKRDIRYTPYGTRIVKRISADPKMTINHVINEVNNKVSTASFRSRADKFDQGKNFRDFYPIKIDRSSIHAGSVLYDPSGHIAVVYDVTKDGRILLIDAHPDQSLSHITYGKKFSRSSVKISGGFMNWRPVKHVQGEFIPTSNDSLRDYSLVQFTGTNEQDPEAVNYRKAEFFYKGEKVDYYDYVRSKMFLGRVRYNPLNELSTRVDELCDDLKARSGAVKNAVAHKISLKKHPKKLPKNIYGTSGEWEDYSTPSRDARFKVLFLETQSMVRKYLKMNRDGNVKISYDGDNLAYDMKKLYTTKANSCRINVTLSTGERRSISLAEVEKRLFDLSFDPYHCAELRWGLTEVLDKKSKKKVDEDQDQEARGWFSRRSDDDEDNVKVKSLCGDRTKVKWYHAEDRLRNQTNRDYKEEMDYGLLGLKIHKLGRKSKPYLNIKEVMEKYLY